MLDAVPNPRSESPERLTYQVTFWQRSAPPGEVPPEHGPFESIVAQMTDTDVQAVLTWAVETAQPWQTYEVHVAAVDRNAGVRLLALYGKCPVESYSP